MECNKDEAVRVKSIAEAKLEKNDFVGAKKFARKAQTLYPKLDGISKLLMNIDVHISAEKRINGEVNWYEVLGVAPTADEKTIKKQYKKLALKFHPDKNSSAGAEGAFKLIYEASSLLLDKKKRSDYDLITGLNGLQEKAPTNTSRPGPSNVYPTRKATAPKPKKKAAPKPSPAPADQKYESFVICGKCTVRTELHWMNDNENLICPNCKSPLD